MGARLHMLTERDADKLAAKLRRHRLDLEILTPKQRAVYNIVARDSDAFLQENSEDMLIIMAMRCEPERYKRKQCPYYQAEVYKTIKTLEAVRAFLARPLPDLPDNPQVISLPRKEGWIYFIEAGGCIKIGFTISVPSRIAQIETATPHEVTLLRQEPGTMEKEAQFHKRFADLHIKGEWFRFEGALRDYLEGRR